MYYEIIFLLRFMCTSNPDFYVWQFYHNVENCVHNLNTV